MAEKILNTRIQLRYDTYENWMAADIPALKKGEIAICEVPVTQTDVNGITSVRPQILMKVGPGNFSALDWTNAKAADVYDWAKQTELFVEKSGEGNVVSSIAWDATLNNGKGGIKFTTASVATSEGLEELQGRVKTIEDTYATDSDLAGAVEAINAAIALKADKSYVDAELAKKQDVIPANTYDAYGAAAAVQGKLDEEVSRAKAAEAALGERIDAIDFVDETELATALTPYAKSADVVANSVYTEKMTALDAKDSELTGLIAAEAERAAGAEDGLNDRLEEVEAFFKLAEDESLDTALDTLKEIQTYITSEGAAADQMVLDIAANAKAIEDEAKRAGEAEVALGGRITTLEGIDHEAYIAADATLKGELNAEIAKKANTADLGELAEMDVADLSLDQYVLKSQAEGYGDILTKTSAATLYQPVGSYAEEVHKHEMADVNGLGDALAAKANSADLKELAYKTEADLGLGALAKKDTVAQSEVDGLSAALAAKADASALGDLAGKDKVAEADLETALATKINGKADDSALAAIAKTGNVNDLVQTSGDVLVFNCGDAAGNPLV